MRRTRRGEVRYATTDAVVFAVDVRYNCSTDSLRRVTHIFYSFILLFTRNGSIKKEIQKKKNKKYTIIKSDSTKKPICIVGYFHNILLSVIFIFIC